MTPSSFPELKDEVTDLECMELLRAGDAEAIRPLIERWEKRLQSFVFRYTQDRHITGDIVQETFVRVLTQGKKFDMNRAFTPWLFTIAANLCRSRHRWQRRHPEDSIEAATDTLQSPRPWLSQLADTGEDPADAAAHREDLQNLKASVMALPHDQKTAVLLHHYEGMGVREIAAVVGCSPRGVETRIYRALQRLRVSVRR